MDSALVLLPVLVCAMLVPCGQSLVCFDNVVVSEPMFIDCSFYGGACAVTNKTTITTSFNGLRLYETELLYHCAHKKRSCLTGPLNYCKDDESRMKNVTCNTWCCTKNKCNVPDQANMTLTTVSKKKALPCYQLIGADEERVKCMFEDAYCLYMSIEPRYSFFSDHGSSSTQLCATKRSCDEMKKTCDLIDQPRRYSYYSLASQKTCTMKCCNTSYCNRKPWNHQYVEKLAPKKTSETKPDWFNSGTYETPTEVNIPEHRWLDPGSYDEKKHRGKKEDDSEPNRADPGPNRHFSPGDNGRSLRSIPRSVWKILLVGIGIVVLIIIAGIVAAKRQCERRNSASRHSAVTAGQKEYRVGYVTGRHV